MDIHTEKSETLLDAALDIETECRLKCETKCDHALDPQTSTISIVGLATDCDFWIFHEASELQDFMRVLKRSFRLGGHNFQFDLHQLRHNWGIDLSDMWGWDTRLEGSLCLDKPTPKYMADYEVERKKQNKKLPTGYSHRAGRENSLKVLAPWHLGVDRFWEDPTCHADIGYLKKDCTYTLALHETLTEKIANQGSTEFLTKRLFPWTQMLFAAEKRGVKINTHLMEEMDKKAAFEAEIYAGALEETFAPQWEKYHAHLRRQIARKYEQKYNKAILKAKDKHKCEARYWKLEESAVAKIPTWFNLNSSDQVGWILKDLGADLREEGGIAGDESTGKPVLNRLEREGVPGVTTLLKYRHASKLTTSFFPSYKELMIDGRLHCRFNPSGTRTGRLSCSSPNLQQVPGELKKLFVADDGRKLITKDMRAIEPAIGAYYTEDPFMYDTVVNGNFHSRNALVMFDLDCEEKDVAEKYPLERFIAKTCGLAVLYGAGWKPIYLTALKHGIFWDQGKCESIHGRLKRAYIEATQFKYALDQKARNEPITNLLGRKKSYPNHRDIHMKAFNTLIQSSASDLLLHCTFNAAQWFKENHWDVHPILWVHDEIVFDAEESIADAAAIKIDEFLTAPVLKTRHGEVPLATEGNIAHFWSK